MLRRLVFRPLTRSHAGLTRAVARYPDWALYLAAALVGLAGGLLAIGFRALINHGSALVFPLAERTLRVFPRAGHLLWPALFAGFGLLLLGLERLTRVPLTGYGFPDYLHGVRRGRARFSLSRTLPRVVAGGLALALGLPVGREGPVAVGGGVIGARFARFLHMGEKYRRLLAAAGTAAAISATFGAPLTGVMFAQEIVLGGESELGHFALLILASAAGAVTARTLGAVDPTFAVRMFEWHSGWELLTYALLGAVIAAVAGLFTAWFLWLRRRGAAWPPWARALAGLSVVGLVAALIPAFGQWLSLDVGAGNLGDGYELTGVALSRGMPLALLLLLLAAKLFTTPLAFESGATGGIFGPALFIGAMTGGAYRIVMTRLFPAHTGPVGSYALVGMATFLGILNRAPLTGMFLVLEMSGFEKAALPCLAALGGSLLAGRWLMPHSLDDRLLAEEGRGLHVPVELGGPVADLPMLPLRAIPPATRLAEIGTALREGQGVIALLDEEGRYRGLIDWQACALAAQNDPDGTLIVAADIATGEPGPLSPADDATAVAALLKEYPAVAVIDDEGRPLGLITRLQLAEALHRQRHPAG